MTYIARIVTVFLLFMIVSCSSNKKKETESETSVSLVKHGKAFDIIQHKGYKEVVIKQSWKDAKVNFTYVVYPKGEQKPPVEADAFVATPVEKVVCFSTSHLAPFDMLGLEDKIVGFPDTKWVTDSTILQKVEVGKITDIGQKNGFNVEQLLALEPDLVIAYSMGNNMEKLTPVQESGIPVVLDADFMEFSPLGRAEWIKFVSVFFEAYDQADAVFSTIEKDYNALKDKASGVEKKPTVMSGNLFGDVWYAPGGNSWAAKFITDAGGNYVWKKSTDKGSLELGYENVLEKAGDSDYWISAAFFETLSEMKKTDERYTQLGAYQSGNIYTYTKRVTPAGGNDYFESGYMRPDLVLSDMVKILHPELLPDYETTYFQRLASE